MSPDGEPNKRYVFDRLLRAPREAWGFKMAHPEHLSSSCGRDAGGGYGTILTRHLSHRFAKNARGGDRTRMSFLDKGF